MEATLRDWTGLPTEILHTIFQLVDERYYQVSAHSFALVCKAWLNVARITLYSRILIKSLPQLKLLYNTLESDPHLGRIVKTLDFALKDFGQTMDKDAREQASIEIHEILTKLLFSYLPKLEQILENGKDEEDSILLSYKPVLNALQHSQLRHLKKIYPTNFIVEDAEIVNYSTCAFLIKDRMEAMHITDYKTNGEQSTFDHLYDKLHQFNKLSELSVLTSTSEGIESFDHVVSTCKNLKKLLFSILPTDREAGHLPQDDNISIDALTNYVPAPHIKALYIFLNDSENLKMLYYIMHKFPKLYDFSIDMEEIAHVDQLILAQLLNFSATIQTFTADSLHVDYRNTAKTFGDYWDAKSSPGIESVKVVYSVDDDSPRRECVLQISKSGDPAVTTTTFSYPASNNNRQHIDFIRKNGKYIGQLSFRFSTDDSLRSTLCELPQDFIAHSFAYCPNLTSLSLEKCILRHLNYSNIDLRKNLSIDELYLNECVVYPGVMEQLTLLLPKIEALYLDKITYLTGGIPPHVYRTDTNTSVIELNLSNSEIGKLFLRPFTLIEYAI